MEAIDGQTIPVGGSRDGCGCCRSLRLRDQRRRPGPSSAISPISSPSSSSAWPRTSSLDSSRKPRSRESSVCGPGAFFSRHPNSEPQPKLVLHRVRTTDLLTTCSRLNSGRTRSRGAHPGSWETRGDLGNDYRRYLLNHATVSFHDSSAAALLYRSGVASLLNPCTAPG